MKHRVFIFLIVFCAISPAIAGWERTYGGSHNDYGHCVKQTSDGGFIITGSTFSYGAGHFDVYLIKTDSSGDTAWTRTYGGSGQDHGYCVIQTTDGGYIITGHTDSYGSGMRDIYVIKTDYNGEVIWTRTYGGSENDESYCIIQTTDEGYAIIGNTSFFGLSYVDIFLLKIDPNGDTSWTKCYDLSSSDRGYSISQVSDCGYIIVGEAKTFPADYTYVYLLRTNYLGDTLWTKLYGSSSNWDSGRSIASTFDSGYIIAGRTASFGAGGSDFWIIKTDSLGDSLWTKTFGDTEVDAAYSILQTPDSGYIAVGHYRDVAVDSTSGMYLIKLDNSGDTLWTRSYGGSAYDCGYSVDQTTDGGYVVTGRTSSFGAGLDDIYLIKTDSLGFTGIEENPPSAKPKAFEISAYPNPFNANCRIMIDDCGMGIDAIEVFDVSGRMVTPPAPLNRGERGKSPLSKRLSPSGGDLGGFIWQPAPSLGSGVYLVRATIGDESATKRIVYLK